MRKAVALSSKGQVVIPADVRRQGRLRPGDRLEVRWENGHVVMERAGVAHSLEVLAKEVQRRYRGRDLAAELREERDRDYRAEKKSRS